MWASSGLWLPFLWLQLLQVIPGVLATTVPRDDVVQRQVLGRRATVLARVAVAHEDLASGEPDLRARSLDHIDQTNYRGQTKGSRGTAHGIEAVFEYLGLATID